MTTPYDDVFDRATQQVTAHVPEPQRDQVLARLTAARQRVNDAWAQHEDLHNEAHVMSQNVQDWRQHAIDMASHWQNRAWSGFANPGGGDTGSPPQATSVSNTGQMSTSTQTSGSTGSVSNLQNIFRRTGTPGANG